MNGDVDAIDRALVPAAGSSRAGMRSMLSVEPR